MQTWRFGPPPLSSKEHDTRGGWTATPAILQLLHSLRMVRCYVTPDAARIAASQIAKTPTRSGLRWGRTEGSLIKFDKNSPEEKKT